MRDLLLRDVEAAHAHAVILGHEQREAAPAAAGFDDALAGFQLQLAAHVMHLRLLRLLDRHRGIGEIRAGVLQCLAIEPQLVEVVADVVVVMNVALRIGQIRRELAAAREQLAEGRVLGRVAVGFEQQRQQIAANFDAPGAVEVAEVQDRG